jgi:hypothetical protein
VADPCSGRAAGGAPAPPTPRSRQCPGQTGTPRRPGAHRWPPPRAPGPSARAAGGITPGRS